MKEIILIVLLVCSTGLFGALQNEKRVDYTGHMIIRTRAADKLQLDHLWNLQTSDKSLDFWTEVLRVGRPVDIHIHAERLAELTASLNSAGIKHHIKVADLGKAIEEERQAIETRREMTKDQKAFDFENYHTYEEIAEYLRKLDNESVLVRVGAIATTHENRRVAGVQISSNRTDQRRPVFAIECAVHAREWAAPSTCLWFINEMVTKYGVDDEVTRLVDGFNWEIVPLMNPDGYEFTWTTDRLWRKTRRPLVNCIGVDLNRNFDVGFGGQGSSNVECSDTYHGPDSFSEPESSGIRDILTSLRDRIKAAVSIHTYSQLWMSPYGYKNQLPSDYPEMLRMMEIGVRGIEATYGTVYDYGNHADTIYVASGVVIDHTYDVQGILHSYLLELRDTGEFEFELPADQIIPTAIETWNGIKAMALDLLRNKE